MKRALAFLGLVTLILSACAPVAAPTAAPATRAAPLPATPAPTATFTSTPAPTATATATPTPIPTLQVGDLTVPDPRAVAPELFDLQTPDAPIPQFVNAMRMAGIELTEEQVAQGIRFQQLKDTDGNPFVVAVYNLDPDPSKQDETLEGPIPLLIWTKEGGWRNFVFKDTLLTSGSNIINIRTVVAVTGEEIDFWEIKRSIPQNFTSGTIPYAYGYDTVERMNGDLNFRLRTAERLGLSNQMLILHLVDTDYVISRKPTSMDELRGLLRETIREAFLKFSKVGQGNHIYSVLNEIHPGTSGYELYKKFGDSFIISAYEIANEIIKSKSPNARLLYNETYNYAREYTFYPDTKRIVDLLRQKDLIDGVGMQMHMSLNGNEVDPQIEEMIEVMRSFGLPVYITEFDINQEHLVGGNKNLAQARIALEVVGACVQSGVCVDLGFFGTEDNYSWIGSDAKAHLFDAAGNPKPFYYAVLQALFYGINSG